MAAMMVEPERDGGEGFGEPKAGFVNEEATHDGEEKREGDREKELLVRGFSPVAECRESVFEEREDGEDGAGLDDDIEQVGAFPDEGGGEVLENEKVSCGRYGKELC
jgi:hypothetical protein